MPSTMSAPRRPAVRRAPRARPPRAPEELEAVVHDLLGQLTAITGAAQLLRRRAERSTVEPAHLRTSLSDIVARAFALGEQLRLALEPMDDAVPCALGPAVRDLVDALEEPRRTRVEVAIADGVPAGPWPPWLVATVVRTLLDNALRYSRSSRRVHVGCEASGRWAYVTVRDAGIGFEADAVPALFTRGYRTASARALGDGHGVGLFACRRAMRRIGGDIVASSPGAGRGATFVAMFPLRRGAAEARMDRTRAR